MADNTENEGSRDIVVVMRGPSAVIFHEGESLQAIDAPTSLGPVKVVLATRWIKRDGFRMPGNLWAEISGKAPNLEDALVPFANAALRLLPTLSLSVNAGIGLLDIEMGFDNTPGIGERDYFQSFIPIERAVLYTARFVNIEATRSLFLAVDTNPESERIGRAATQCRLALDYWRLGQESLALSHLWMALEALTKAKIRKECIARGVKSPEQLAECFSIKLCELDPYIRRELLLNGDTKCYRHAKAASDGIEHGFENYREINNLSKKVRNPLASYVRNAIFELCDLNEKTRNKLTGKPYDKPLGHWALVKYLRGKLVGEGDRLGAPGNLYPILDWKTTIKHAAVDRESKEFNVTATDNIKPRIAKGISFQLERHELWQPE